MKVLIFYHPDADGITAAAIVRHALQQRYASVRFEFIRQGYLYEDRRLQKLRPDSHTQIYVVDISFRPETTRRLQQAFGPDFIWIDHHLTALEAWRATGWEEPAGIRNTIHSAAWLTWHHLFTAPAPLAVTWADKYDLWQQDAEWETLTCPWQLVVTHRFSFPEYYDLRVFSDERLLNGYLRRYGQPMLAYEQQLRRREASAVQPVVLSLDDRSYRLLFLNSSLRDSQTLATWHRLHPEVEADGYLVGQLIPPMRWKLSLYTGDRAGIDAARIAQQFGGGGHASAAGFTLT
ncbi:MAG: DHH family phosphoesterase, partial [Alistipes sp.]|uniref:DHH family phosphoesterase n=1 Tax=Alistipes sp. TaxID=1872444 RepID=UPI0025C03DD7